MLLTALVRKSSAAERTGEPVRGGEALRARQGVTRCRCEVELRNVRIADRDLVVGVCLSGGSGGGGAQPGGS